MYQFKSPVLWLRLSFVNLRDASMTYERKKYYLKEILIDLNHTHTYSERNTFRYCIHTFANKYLYAFSHQTFAVEKIPIFFWHLLELLYWMCCSFYYPFFSVHCLSSHLQLESIQIAFISNTVIDHKIELNWTNSIQFNSKIWVAQLFIFNSISWLKLTSQVAWKFAVILFKS